MKSYSKIKLILILAFLLIFTSCSGNYSFEKNNYNDSSVYSGKVSVNHAKVVSEKVYYTDNKLDLSQFPQKIGDYVLHHYNFDNHPDQFSNFSFRIRYINKSFTGMGEVTLIKLNSNYNRNFFFKKLVYFNKIKTNEGYILNSSNNIIWFTNDKTFNIILISNLDKITQDLFFKTFVKEFPIDSKILENIDFKTKKEIYNDYQNNLKTKIEQQSQSGSQITVERLGENGVYLKRNGNAVLINSIKISQNTTQVCPIISNITLNSNTVQKIPLNNCNFLDGHSYKTVIITPNGVYSAENIFHGSSQNNFTVTPKLSVGLSVFEVTANNTQDGLINKGIDSISTLFQLSLGSTPLKLSDLSVTLISNNGSYQYSYDPNNSFGSTNTFGVGAIRGSIQDGYFNSEDVLKLNIISAENIGENSQFTLRFFPANGNPLPISIVTPQVMTQKFTVLK